MKNPIRTSGVKYTLLLALISVIFSGCAAFRSVTRKAETTTEMRDIIASKLGNFDTKQEIIKFLTEEGFECEFVENGAFDDRVGRVENDFDYERDHSGGVIGFDEPFRRFQNKDFVYGTRQGSADLILTERWVIAVTINSDGKPVDAYVLHRYMK